MNNGLTSIDNNITAFLRTETLHKFVITFTLMGISFLYDEEYKGTRDNSTSSFEATWSSFSINASLTREKGNEWVNRNIFFIQIPARAK